MELKLFGAASIPLTASLANTYILNRVSHDTGFFFVLHAPEALGDCLRNPASIENEASCYCT